MTTTLAKVRFYISVFSMLCGFTLSLSIIYNKSFWTLWIFIIGLIIGAISFKNVAICLENVNYVEKQIRKKVSFENHSKKNKVVILILFLLGSGVLGVGVLFDYYSILIVGIPMITLGSIILSFLIVAELIIKEARKFVVVNNIKMQSYY